MIFSSLLFIVAAVSTSSARMIVSHPQPRKSFARPVKYAAEDVSDFFMPGPVIRPTFPPPFFASDAENLQNGGINLGEITRIAGQINEIGHILDFDADDLDDGDYDAMIDAACKVISTICKVADTGFKVHDTAKKSRGSAQSEALGFAADEIDDIPIPAACAIIGAACALANTGMNVYDHVKGSDCDGAKGDQQAGGKNFDAEDAEDFPIIPACAVIGAGCAIIDTGLNIYDHIKGDDESEELSNMYIPPSSVPLPSNFPGGFKPIYLDAEDLHNGINWGEITKKAGQVNEIGHILGFDAESESLENMFGAEETVRRINAELRKAEQRAKQQRKQQIMEEETWRTEARKQVEAKWAQKMKTLGFAAEDAEELSNLMSIGLEKFKERQRKLEAEKKLARKRAIMAEATKEAEAEMRQKYNEMLKK